MDVAKDFANPEVYLLVKNKWDSLAPDKDIKGAKKRQTATVKQKSSTWHIDVRETLTFKVVVVGTAVVVRLHVVCPSVCNDQVQVP